MNREDASCEYMSALNYGSLPALDKSFVSSSLAVIANSRSLPLDVSNNVQLKFPIPATQLFFDPSRLYFHLQVQVQNSDDPKKKAIEKSSVICGLGYTIWDKLKLSAKGKLVRQYSYNAFASHLGVLCNLDAGYIESVLGSTSAFYKDTEPVNDDTWIANQGNFKRMHLVANGRILDMKSQVFLPPFMTQQLLPCNAGWEIEGTLNSNEFCLIYDNKTDPTLKQKLVLLKAELCISMVDLEQSAYASIERGLAESPMQIPFVDYDVVNMSIQSGQAEYSSPSSVSPFCRRMMIVFMTETDFIGSFETTPFYYRNMKIGELEVSANGRKHGFITDFDNRQYIEAYTGLIDAMGVRNRTFPLDRNDFARAQTIFAFDLTKPGFLANCQDVISADSETTTWSIRVNFREKLSANTQMIIILEQEKTMLIDNVMNVSIV